MDGPITEPARRTLTPAVLASALFVAASAVIAILFVAARGGLQMPLASSGSQVAVATPGPTAAPSTQVPGFTPLPSMPEGTTAPATPAPSPAPTSTPIPTPAGTPDALAGLPGCADLPGCYEYLIKRGDSLSGVASHYAIPVSIVLALNPDITDPSTIVVGQVLFLGRSPFLRLEPCETVPDCSLYTVRPGNRLSTIAGRFGITVESILAANELITDPNAIFSGQVIRLPHPEA